MTRLRRTRRGALVALLAVLANLLAPSLHDLTARASDGERITICAPQGLVTIIVSDGEAKRPNSSPFNQLCPDCPTCPMCTTAHAPLALLPKAGTDVHAPASVDGAWPKTSDIAAPMRTEWRPSFPRAPPAAG
jgi:hypothetical protein